MLDTVKVRIQPGEATAQAVERRMVRRTAVDLGTGEMHSELTGNWLPGSWAEKVRVTVQRTELRCDRTVQQILREAGQERKSRLPVAVSCEPWVEIEGSIHKALMGHNVSGGPDELLPAVRWLVQEIGRRLGVELPDGGDWELLRCDWAEVYRLGFQGVREYIDGLGLAQFPRRKVQHYAEEAVYVGGFSTAVKLYHKGPEFHTHDRPRLLAVAAEGVVQSLQEEANELLRAEVEVKVRTIRAAYGDKARVRDVSTEWLRAVHDREVLRLLREAETDMTTVRTFHAVDERLREVYGEELGRVLFGTWARLAAKGEKETKGDMPRRTWYRHVTQLKGAGVSWHVTDLHLSPRVSAVPEGFSPVRTDPRRLTDVAAQVATALRPFALAA